MQNRYEVTIYPAGKLKLNYYDPEDDEDKAVETDDVLPVLWYTCSIEDGVRVIDIFELFLKHRQELQPLFSDHYFDRFVNEYVNSEKQESDLDELVVSKYMDIYEDDSLNSSSNVHVYGRKDGDSKHWGIGFVPVGELLGVDFVLANEFILNDYRTGEPDKVDNAKYTLFEVLNGFMYELSFHGTPESKKGRKNELENRSEQIEELTNE